LDEEFLVISDTLIVRDARSEGAVGLKAPLSASQATCATRPDAVVGAERHTAAKWFAFPHKSQVLPQAGQADFRVPRPWEVEPHPLHETEGDGFFSGMNLLKFFSSGEVLPERGWWGDDAEPP